MEKEEFLRLLPKLILEDNDVKGAIITALSGVVATKDDIARIIEHSDRRFDDINKRFEAMQLQMDKRFEAMQQQMDKRFEALQIQIDTNYKELRSEIRSFGSRSGKSLEASVLKLLQEQHKLSGLEITKIERRDLIDADGLVFVKGYATDVDVLMEDGKTILIDIKFKADNRDLHHFFDVARLFEKLYKKPDELWVLSLEITPKTLAIATKYPFKMIYGKIKR